MVVLRSRTSTPRWRRKYIEKGCDISCEYRNFFVPLRRFLGKPDGGLTHMRMKATKKNIKPRAPRKYKSAESKAREAAHHFGKEGGNPGCNQSLATNQREFYRWAETIATPAELDAYIADKTHPLARIKFCELLKEADDLNDIFALTNQTHGAPKQPIEVQTLPKVECEFFGDE